MGVQMYGVVATVSPGRCFNWVRRQETTEVAWALLMYEGMAAAPLGRYTSLVCQQATAGDGVGVADVCRRGKGPSPKVIQLRASVRNV